MSENYGGLLRIDTAFATGFVVEMGFYCAYTYLFIAALPGMTSARRLKDPHSARSTWVFLTVSILMYLVATLHLILAAFRFYKSIFLNIDPNGAISYLNHFNHWEYLWLIVLFAVQTWMGDALVIYRCYFVWDSNLWLILVPVCLLLASTVINIFSTWYWIHDPFSVAPNLGIQLFRSIYPLSFVQNFMTTSLIIVKIFLRHRASKKAGVVQVGSMLSPIRVARIVTESAAIYTIELLVLIILYFRRDNAQFVIQAIITPSIGITFVLLAIRIQSSRIATMRPDLGITSTLIPQWLRNTENESDIGAEGHRDHGVSPVGDGTELTNVQKADALPRDGCMDKCDTESSSNAAKRSITATLSV